MSAEQNMILVADIGNSEIDFGIFEKPPGKRPLPWASARRVFWGPACRVGNGARTGGLCFGSFSHFSKKTDLWETPDEIELFVDRIIQNLSIPPEKIVGTAICSVVPEVARTVDIAFRQLFHGKPFHLNHAVKLPVKIRVNNPDEIGCDRVSNAAAAFYKYRGPLIVVDCGTATTFTVVSAKGELLGGAIMPGVKLMQNSLASNTAKLPFFPLDRPKTFIGKNTRDAMKSGIIHGYVGAITNIIEGIKKEMKNPEVKIIATGGLSHIIDSINPKIATVEPFLTLEGIAISYFLNE